MRVKTTLAILLSTVSCLALGQPQLVLLKREKVIARFEYGDDFTYKLKKSTKFTKGAMLGATEFGVITFSDTIPFSSIDRVSLKGHRSKSSLLSKLLITAGLTYFLVDQFNHVVVQGQTPDLEPTVWKPSLILVTTGYALKFVRKRSQRIRFPAKLVTAERGTRFYKYDE